MPSLKELPTGAAILHVLSIDGPEDQKDARTIRLFDRGEFILGKESELSFPPMMTPDAFDNEVRRDPLFALSVAGFTTVGLEHFKRGMTPKGVSILPYGEPGEELLYISNTRPTMEKVFGEDTDFEDPVKIRGLNSGYGEYATICESLFSYSPLSFGEVGRGVRSVLYDNEIREYMDDPTTDRYGMSERISVGDMLKNLNIRSASIPLIAKRLHNRQGVQVAYKASEEFFDFVRDQEHPLDSAADQAMALKRSVPGKYILAVIPYGREEQSYYQSVAAQ